VVGNAVNGIDTVSGTQKGISDNFCFIWVLGEINNVNLYIQINIFINSSKEKKK